MPLETSYTSRSAGSPGAGGAVPDSGGKEYWSHHRCKKAFTDFQFTKREERDEQKQSRDYYHCVQFTPEQARILNKRKQPIMTINKIARKLNGTVGVIEARRQDPKAYARTPMHAEGAELATAVLRYVMEQQQWDAKSPLVALSGAVNGLGGLILDLEPGDKGDHDVSLDVVDIRQFFYDPMSSRLDFSDARYMGYSKLFDLDDAEDMYPDADPILFVDDQELMSDSEVRARWFESGDDGVVKRVRIVDLWYKHKGGWCWSQFTAAGILKEGKSYLKDEKGKDFCKFLMFSSNADNDDDRYGFVRDMKSPQDSVNATRSKMQHIMSSNKLFISQGAVTDVEKTRAEMARPDGVIITHGPVGDGVKESDKVTDFSGWERLLTFANTEIENFGPNREQLGDTSDAKSGRAISIRQQAGMAELGPYALAFKGWKIRVYRAIWNAVRDHWQAERWIRVTDDEKLEGFWINQLSLNQQTGMPEIVNQIGALDVDIILDEGPDTVTMMQDLYETLQQVMPAVAPIMPPAKLQAMADMLIELSPLDSAMKKRYREAGQQPDPMQQQQQQLMLEDAMATVQDKQAAAGLKQAQTVKAYADAEVAPMEAMMNGQPMEQQEYEVPAELQDAQAMADIEETHASAEQKRAAAYKAQQEGRLAPQKMQMEAAQKAADRQLQARSADADRNLTARNSSQELKIKAKQAAKPSSPARR
jgi:hypothetical protein